MARLLTYTIEQGRSICDSLGFVTVSLGGEYFQAPVIMATVTASVLPGSGALEEAGGYNTTPSAGGAFMQNDKNSNAHLVSFNNSTNQAIFGGGVSGSIINYTAFGLRKRG